MKPSTNTPGAEQQRCDWCQFHSRSAGCARPIDAGFLHLIDGYTSRPPPKWASHCPVYAPRPSATVHNLGQWGKGAVVTGGR